MPNPDYADAESESNLPPRVIVQVTWQDKIYKCEKLFIPGVADQSHYAIDQAVWDATIEVRRALARQRYPEAQLDSAKVPLRNEFELQADVRNYLAKEGNRYLALTPPNRELGLSQWHAQFPRLHRSGLEIERHPPTGVGGTDQVALENLVRFIEGREPFDG